MALSTAQYAALSSAAYSDFGGLVTDSYNPLVSTLKKMVSSSNTTTKTPAK